MGIQCIEVEGSDSDMGVVFNTDCVYRAMEMILSGSTTTE